MSNNKKDYASYIIYVSEDVPVVVRMRDIVLTVAAWSVYVYFIRTAWPFMVDLVSWVMHGFDELTSYANLSIMPTIEDYGEVALIVIAVYLSWAIYNLLRFRGRVRRKSRAAVEPEDLASMYGFSTANVTEWQNSSSLIMHLDPQGHLTEVNIVP
jgi:poly-beta-1,6-N-acetyl-D-glucosamine biosynthesis protein PgaD